MTSREKVLAIEAQIRNMLEGEQTDFHCPFCELTTTEGEGLLCCDEAAEVVNAVLDHIDHLERVELVNRVMDRFSVSESKVILN
jgi:hypothetical protein